MQQEQWQTLYQEAVLETDSDKLKERIRSAEEAIAARSSLDGQVSHEERVALEDSQLMLQVLKRERVTN